MVCADTKSTQRSPSYMTLGRRTALMSEQCQRVTIPVELTKICCLVFVFRGLSPVVCVCIFTQFFLLALGSMAGLHCGLLLYVMPCLVHLTDQFGEPINCGTILGKCGTNAEISCSAGSDLTDATVEGPYNTNTDKMPTRLNMTSPTSQDGRLQFTWSGNTSHILINRVQHSDAGTYRFYLKTKDSSGPYQADLQIEGSSEVPNITTSVCKDKKIVCQATGGCPVGTIQWKDGSRTNWTQSATSEEKNGVLTSTLLLQSCEGAEYYCTVTYWLLNKKENQTRPEYKEPGRLIPDPVDPVGPNYAMYILFPVAILICALLALWMYYRRRCVHQVSANDVPGQSSPSHPLVLNDTEMATGAQSSRQIALIS